MLKLVENERVIFCDIDDTLIMHGEDKDNPLWEYVNVVDPLYEVTCLKMRVNEPMVRLVKEEINRGSEVVFWSRGGYQWAANVLEALGFGKLKREFLVMTKPFAYFDDKPASSWLVDRVYLDPDTIYKK